MFNHNVLQQVKQYEKNMCLLLDNVGYISPLKMGDLE